MTFDPSKPVRCRNGRAARIVATINDPDYPFVGAIAREDGKTEYQAHWMADGRRYAGLSSDWSDLVNVEEEKPAASPLDTDLPVRTRDGRKARIVATDAGGDEPIVALVDDQKRPGVSHAVHYRANGRFITSVETPNDLLNVPVSGTKWINVWSTGPFDCSTYNSREAADAAAERIEQGKCQRRLACVSVDWQQGVGL